MTDVADLRLGFIGGGRHATANLYPSIALAGGRVTAVATRSQASASAAAHRHGADRAYASYEAMLADGGLDAVLVSLDPTDQAPVTEACLRAGLHVFVEKPLGLTAADAARVADAADAAGRHVMVGFMKRFAPSYRHVAEVMTDTERFGTPMAFRMTFAFSPWTDQLREDTFLLFAAIHMVDLVRALFGEITGVSGHRRSDGADITMAFSVRAANGIIGTLDLASLASWGRGHEELTVHGTRGFVTATDLHRVRLHVDRRRPEEPPRWQGLDEDTVVIEAATSTGSGGQRDLYQRGFVGEVDHFLTCIAQGRAPHPSARDNIATMALCERLLAV